VVTGREASLDEVFLGAAAQLFQAGRFVAAGHPSVEILERGTPPERKRSG
jgi:hypothetical protein